MYLNNEIYSTKLQRSVIRKYDRYQHTPHNRVGLHKIQHEHILPKFVDVFTSS